MAEPKGEVTRVVEEGGCYRVEGRVEGDQKASFHVSKEAVHQHCKTDKDARRFFTESLGLSVQREGREG